jgi:tripartite ATP-independent transporter DctM subunit
LIGPGVQVAGALGVVSVVVLYVVAGDWQGAWRLIADAVAGGLHDDAMLAIPLLSLMGVFIARSGAAAELFWAVTRLLRNVPVGAPLAAIVGGAINAFAAGNSTIAVANFARIVYPELRRRGHDRAFALGTLVNASVLGMLLPPGVLMAAWAVLGQQPAGAIFLAALTPAFAVALCLGLCVVFVTRRTQAPHQGKMSARPAQAIGSVLGLTLIFGVFFGGLAARVLSPAQAAGVGAAIAMLMALRKGMPLAGIAHALRVTARFVWPVLLQLFMGLLYGQALSVTGVGAAIQDLLASFGPALGLAAVIVIWLVLAIVLNSISVLALTVVLFGPLATRFGLDPLAFAVIGVIVVKAAQLLPPLGLLVYAAKAAADDDIVSVADIFRFVLPLAAILFAAIVAIAIFPKVAIWLPYLVR